jgi:hypothetical protein
MAKEHAHPADESLKIQGDPLDGATASDPHSVVPSGVASKSTPDPIPVPENGGHEKSHAAHLGHVHEQTKPADMIRQGAASNSLREPPMVVQRVGKQHR